MLERIALNSPTNRTTRPAIAKKTIKLDVPDECAKKKASRGSLLARFSSGFLVAVKHTQLFFLISFPNTNVIRRTGHVRACMSGEEDTRKDTRNVAYLRVTNLMNVN